MGQVLNIILAVLGFLIRWLLHLNNAQTRAKERMRKALIPAEQEKEKFSWHIYFCDNWVMMSISFLSTVALFFLAPILLELVGYGVELKGNLEVIGNLVAFLGGLFNVELIYALKRKVIDKLKYTRKRRT